jgi:hypothetical protein
MFVKNNQVSLCDLGVAFADMVGAAGHLQLGEIRMREIRITDSLLFSKDPHGATLLFFAPGQIVLDYWVVVMNYRTLKACRKALDADQVLWRNNDRGLTIEGTRGEITLTFALQSPPFGSRIITLSGSALAAFRVALESLGGT